MKTISDQDIKFRLKEPKADHHTLILLVYRYNYQKFVYSTAQTIHPANWEKGRNRALTNQKNREDRRPFELLNKELDRHRDKLKKVLADLTLADQTWTNDLIRERLTVELTPEDQQKPKKQKESFLEFIDRFVKECKAGKRLTAKNTLYAGATIKDYTKTLNNLKAYQTERKRPIDYEHITLAFYNDYKKYLTKEGYSLNTIGALLKNLKILLKQAYRDGLHQNQAFEHEDFKKVQEEVDNIYLTDEELNRLFALDLPRGSKLDRVRDIFLIGCYTGLRFSNFSQIQPENITNGGRMLTVVAVKNGPQVKIPLNPKVLAILAKHNNIPPRSISNQKFNMYLKDLAKLAGINELVQITRTKGGHRVTITKEKWELTSSHTARRSFATNAYKNGVSTLDIMKLTGHKTETSFIKYIKVTAEETATRLLNHPHFLEPVLKIAQGL